MTTAVQILVPKPNHKRVRVDQVFVNSEGVEGEVLNSEEVGQGHVSETFYLHNNAMLKITEID